MKFKDKLKKLRRDRGISQQTLADSIFVSRSAVAKWENGLGLPSEDSYIALSEFFEISTDELLADESEAVSVEQKCRRRKIYLGLEIVFIIFILLFSVLIAISVFSDSYGLVSEMAAGPVFADNPRYDFCDYDIYYGTIDFIIETDGEKKVYPQIHSFRPVRKMPIGYAVFEDDYRFRNVYSDGERVGIIYSIEGRDCYYNIFRATVGNRICSIDLFTFESIFVNGKEYAAEHYSFFITEDLPVGEMTVGQVGMTIDEEYRFRS